MTNLTLEKVQELIGDSEAIERKYVTAQVLEAAKYLASQPSLFFIADGNWDTIDYPANFSLIESAITKFGIKSARQEKAMNILAAYLLNMQIR